MNALVHVDLRQVAGSLPEAWTSTVLGRASDANVKVLRMDASDYADEIHAHPEALLVVDGHMNLRVGGGLRRIAAGEVVIIPAGTVHGVAAGSIGTLFVVGV